MKKIALLLSALALLFIVGCSNKKVAETDFLVKIKEVGSINSVYYFEISSIVDIKNLSFQYEIICRVDSSNDKYQKGDLLDTGTANVGDVKAERKYLILINSYPADAHLGWLNELKIISATGTVAE